MAESRLFKRVGLLLALSTLLLVLALLFRNGGSGRLGSLDLLLLMGCLLAMLAGLALWRWPEALGWRLILTGQLIETFFGDEAPARRALIPVLMVLLIAYAMRVHALDSRKLWTDELFTWHAASAETPAEVIGRIAANGLPLPLLGDWAWIQVAGDSEFALRTPPLLWGLLSVALIYALGRRFDARAGFAAALLMAVSWLPVMHSQEARPYPMLLAGSLICGLGLVTWLRARPSTRPALPLILLGLGAGIAVQAHYFGIFAPGLAGLILLLAALRNRLPGARWLPALIALGLGTLTLLPAALTVPREAGVATWVPDLSVGQAARVYLLSLFNESPWISGLAAALLLWALIHLARRDRDSLRADGPGLIALGLWLLLPPLALFALSQALTPIFLIRYLIHAAPAAWLLLGWALWKLPLKTPGRLLILLGFAGLLAFDLFFVHYQYNERSRVQTEAAYQFALDRGAAESSTLFVVQTWHVQGARWFADYPLIQLGVVRRIDLGAGNAADIPALEAALAAGDYESVVLLRVERPVEPEFLAWLDQHYHLQSYEILSGSHELWIYTRRN